MRCVGTKKNCLFLNTDVLFSWFYIKLCWAILLCYSECIMVNYKICKYRNAFAAAEEFCSFMAVK